MSLLAAISRSLVVLFWLASAAYAFLTSVPFVHEQFLQPGLVPALATFARWHGWLALAMAPVAALGLWPDIASRRAARTGSLLAAALALTGAALAAGAPMSTLGPGGGALTFCVLSLLPVVGFAALDLSQAPSGGPTRPPDRGGRDAVALAVSAVAVAGLYGLMGVLVGRAPDWLGGLQSLAAHTVLFAALLAAITGVRAGADLTSKPARWEALSAIGLLALLIGSALALVLLPALSVSGRAAPAAVATFGAVVALALGARGLRSGSGSEQDGVLRVMSGLLPAWARSSKLPLRLAWVAVVVSCAVAFRAASGSLDWNFVLAKLGAVATWFLILATLVHWIPARVRIHAASPYAVSVLAVAAFLTAAGRLPAGPVTVEAATAAADAWAVGDPSFRTLRDWLHRPVPDADAGSADEGGVGFFDFVQSHTNIARSVDVRPVAVHLAPLGGTPGARRPHVFVFVVDSLRRDYLSVYNPRVGFTPAIGRFAAESIVFTRALTRYGATGLSVPSIWVGGMVLHKQYVTPFAPMNALHALLGHHGYRRWMSMDNILEVIMPRDASLEEIDAKRGVGDFRFCSSIDELRGRLDRVTPEAPPVFAWSLPQDIHVAVLNREGNAAVDGGRYDGFHAPYASRIRRFDACFGAFIDDLKTRGLYDDSIVILTSDHGDSLGEEGRWGHAYTIYPEVLQVPLVVHLPAWARDRVEVDPEQLAFTTDITPTLYALLGHTPNEVSPIFGRPLVRPAGTPPPAREPFGLVASSYGSVYGWIGARGDELYIADGVALRDYSYRLDGSPTGVNTPVTAAARVAGQRAIRAGIRAIADYYQFVPAAR